MSIEGTDLFFDIQDSFVPPVSLAPATTALVIVDMQYHDAHPDGCFNVAMDKIQPGSMDYFNARTESTTVPAIVRLLEAFRSRNMQVIHLMLGSAHEDYRDLDPRLREWVQAVEARSGMRHLFWSGNPDYAIRDELTPLESEIVVAKTSFGAFNGSEFDSIARSVPLTSLVFVGISTNCCVESTIRDAAERGYGCVVIDEGTADYDEFAHVASLRGLAFNHARVVEKVSDVIAALDTQSPL